MFFSKFDKISYDPLDNKHAKLATNIINSILVKYHTATNTTAYLYHMVKDGETPEILAAQKFGNAFYHWIIILMNDIVDPIYDWPLDANRFQAMLTMRYLAGNENDIHILSNTSITVNDIVWPHGGTPSTTPVTTNHFVWGDIPPVGKTPGRIVDEYNAIIAQIYFNTFGSYPATMLPISNRDYELERNDVKREIKILRRKYLTDFVNDFEDLLSRELLV